MHVCGCAGHTTTEVFASGGVHALIRLLENVLEFAAEPQRSVWVREVLALLYPLVRRSRMVARLLVRPCTELAAIVSNPSAVRKRSTTWGTQLKHTWQGCARDKPGLSRAFAQ